MTESLQKKKKIKKKTEKKKEVREDVKHIFLLCLTQSLLCLSVSSSSNGDRGISTCIVFSNKALGTVKVVHRIYMHKQQRHNIKVCKLAKAHKMEHDVCLIWCLRSISHIKIE